MIILAVFKIIFASFPLSLALTSQSKPHFSEINSPVQNKKVTQVKADITVNEINSLPNLDVSSDKSFTEFKKSNEPLFAAFAEFNKKNQNMKEAIEQIKKWNPSNTVLIHYKDFFLSTWTGNYEDIYKLYIDLKKNKKFIRLRLELLVYLMNSPILELKFPLAEKFIKNESRLLVRQLRASSEGEVFEEQYLKWLHRNKFFEEICSTERSRWIAETKIEFIELVTATKSCPVTIDDFIMRLRRLLFAAKDYQALREIDLFASHAKIKDWEKVYLRAIYDSHQGDPVSALKNLSRHESQILDSDYRNNYFFIAQRAGELEKAEAIVAQILKKMSKRSEIDEMRFQQAFLFYQIKKYKQAHAIFDELYKKHPQYKKKRRGRISRDFDQLAWLRAWTLYLDGQYEAALKAFNETIGFAIDEARLAYWVADTKSKMGDETSAISGFKTLSAPVSENKSFSYYNLLAWLRFENLKKDYQDNSVLKNIALMAKMNRSPFPVASESQTYSQIMASYSFFDRTNYETDVGDVQIINSENEIINNTEILGIAVTSEKELSDQINWSKFLILQKESDLARWHLYEIEKKINTRQKAEQLVKFYLDQQFYYRALSLMNRFGQTNKTALSVKADPILWSALYPEAYKDKVFKYAEKRKIDPYLILSIMRAETQYKSDAISPVGAVGLMQFMPYSAQKVADITNQKIETAELFAPEKSIEFGATYLKKLSVELNHQKPLVAAAYNGGPHRVKSWIKNLGQIEFDRFIEHIPFSETRTYVKRVLTYRATYDKLYNKSIKFDRYDYLLKPIPFKLEEPISLKEEWDQFRFDL